MANTWLRLYHDMPNDLSPIAMHLTIVAYGTAYDQRSCYPDWRAVEQASDLDRNSFDTAFEELCEAGVVFDGFPSLIVSLAEEFPIAPMFGPLTFGHRGRPIGGTWAKIRRAIFLRDDFTCQYCGVRGGSLECDHVIPVSRGGGHTDENLVTACRKCNRSKRCKLVSEWKAA